MNNVIETYRWHMYRFAYAMNFHGIEYHQYRRSTVVFVLRRRQEGALHMFRAI